MSIPVPPGGKLYKPGMLSGKSVREVSDSPPGDHDVVAEQKERAKSDKQPDPLGFGAHAPKSRDHSPSELPASGQLQHEHWQTACKDSEKVGKQEGPASTHADDVGKAPDVAEADG